jgi:hypothetical protein
MVNQWLIRLGLPLIPQKSQISMTGVRSASSERYLRDTAASQIICKEHRRQQE